MLMKLVAAVMLAVAAVGKSRNCSAPPEAFRCLLTGNLHCSLH
jgi:hypothetical protein